MNDNVIKKGVDDIGQTKPVQLVIVEGLVDNLPEILSTIKDVFRISKQEKIINNYLKTD